MFEREDTADLQGVMFGKIKDPLVIEAPLELAVDQHVSEEDYVARLRMTPRLGDLHEVSLHRGQYSGHIFTLDQSEASIHVK